MRTEPSKNPVYLPQVKICGLTREDEALACIQMGAQAIGCVFYPPSPRHVTNSQAAGISRALASVPCKVVGVFVNEPFETIMKKVEKCGLHIVQLHGSEPPDLVNRLTREGVPVIKGLFVNAKPSFSASATFDALSYLTECAGGPLPGGNAEVWNWRDAIHVSANYPMILAGGLTPENVIEAIGAARPDAVDVSSGVEATPGRKDPDKVKRFLDAVARIGSTGKTRRIF